MPKPTRGFQVRLSEGQREEIRALYRSGVPYGEIIQQFGCSVSNFWLTVRGIRGEVLRENYGLSAETLNAIPPVKLGWVAGIIDGEGYIGLVPTKATLNERGFGVMPRVEVSSASREMQDELARVLGFGLVYDRSNAKRRPNEKPQFTWAIWSAQVIGPLLQVLAPHLVVKRKVASVVQSFCERRIENDMKPYTAADLSDIAEVRRLNARGAKKVVDTTAGRTS